MNIEYKVGDIVELIDDKNFPWIHKGCIGVITKINSSLELEIDFTRFYNNFYTMPNNVRSINHVKHNRSDTYMSIKHSQEILRRLS